MTKANQEKRTTGPKPEWVTAPIATNSIVPEKA